MERMMRAADALLEKIIEASQIPSGKRRREVERELRGHFEDFVVGARAAGYGEDEIERMAIANFGDPLEVARNFGWVYRRERALLRLWVFGLSTAAVAILIAAGTLTVQAGVAAGFGVPFSGRHSMIEMWDILATVAVYVGMISVERAFPAWGTRQIMLACVAGAATGLALHAPFLTFGFASAAFLRAFLRVPRGRALGWIATPVCFGAVGVLFWVRWQGTYPLAAGVASWMVTGAAYQAMTGLAARVDRKLWTTFG
jgi:hypothetical protein